MAEPKAKTTDPAPDPATPPGFDAVPYPDLERETTPTLYVCQTCHPPWDTFDPEAAVAHTSSPAHAEGTARNDARKARAV